MPYYKCGAGSDDVQGVRGTFRAACQHPSRISRCLRGPVHSETSASRISFRQHLALPKICQISVHVLGPKELNFAGLFNDTMLSEPQIKLEVEILPGLQVRKVVVDFAKSHKNCKLILGSNKHFTVR